jgi:hypothetical protein
MAAASLPAMDTTAEAGPAGHAPRAAMAGLGPAPGGAPATAAGTGPTPASRAEIDPAARVDTVPAAVIGVVLLVLALGVRVLLTVFVAGLGRSIVNAEVVDQGELDRLGVLLLLNPVIALVAIAGLGYWASRVVANIPRLGGGWPQFTPGQAFIEHVIPGWNVLRVPAVYRDIQARLSPEGRSSDLLLLLWIVATVAAVLVVRPIGSFLAGLAPTTEGAIGTEIVVAAVSIALQAVAVLAIVMIVVDVEGLQAARVRELEGAGPRTAGPPPVSAAAAAEAAAAFATRSITAVGGHRVTLENDSRAPEPEPPPPIDAAGPEGEQTP